MHAVSQFLNSNFTTTAVVSIILGFLTFKNTRAGQRDTNKMQDKANTISENQNALNAYKDLLQTEHDRRVEAEADNKELRQYVRKDFEAAIKSCEIEPSSTSASPPKGKT